MAELDISQIQSHNPWWQRVEFILDNPYLTELAGQRFIYRHPLLKNFPVDKDAILTLRGPRRIGKTTLLTQIIRFLLLEKKVPPQNVMFYPGDTLVDFKELFDLLKTYLDYIRPRSQQRIYIFLDEISFVKGWQRAVKQLADERQFKKATLLITGSNILDLKFSSERMPGRRGKVFPWDIEFLPLSFNEYLALVAPDEIAPDYFTANNNLPHLRKHFQDYLLVGGFPTTINEYHQKNYLKPETYEIFLSWIEGDLHQVGKSEEIAYNILRRLFVHLTAKVSFYKLTREAGLVSHEATQDYLDIFEKMFLAFQLPHFDLDQQRLEPRKNRKFYLSDPFIYNALKAKADGFSHQAFSYSQNVIVAENQLPTLVENTAAAYLKRFYPKIYVGESSLGEIDIVGFKENQYSYFEVKYQKKIETKPLKNLQQKIKRPLVVLTRQTYRDDPVHLLPAEVFLSISPQKTNPITIL